MYSAIFLLFFFAGIVLVGFAIKRRSIKLGLGGAGVVVLGMILFTVLSLWGELLWFDALGYADRFWTVVLTKPLLAIFGALLGFAAVYLLMLPVGKERRYFTLAPALLGAFIGLGWGGGNWDRLLLFLNRAPSGVKDPIFERTASFYFFVLPFLDEVYNLLVMLALVAVFVSVVSLFVRVQGSNFELHDPWTEGQPTAQRGRALRYSAAALLIVFAFGKYLDRYHLMYSTLGAVTGPGWTDVHIKLPAYWVATVVTGILGVALLVKPARQRLAALFRRSAPEKKGSGLGAPVAAVAIMVVVWFVGLTAIPAVFQWLRVEPNEITFEKPYIAHNIDYTRKGFRLDEVEEREFPVSGKFNQRMVEQNRNLFDNIRLWDYRALDSVYQQFQEIRLYYEFVDVDIDRYTIGDTYRQVMVSARELQVSNLPEQSQTFVNEVFKYTHGYGLTMTGVSEFTSGGLPKLLIKDIPPVTEHPDLQVERPQIYYGELTDNYVVTNSSESEFDYPSGEKNVYIRYPGKGGVQLSNLWRKFLYGYKFGGTRFFVSSYPTTESRLMFHRDVRTRVKTLAPFLHFDDDPYVVLVDGRMHWIVDAYTTSAYFPYSEPFRSGAVIKQQVTGQEPERGLGAQTLGYLRGANYIRNSVKAVVDAFDGTVNFYIFEPDDPLIRTWDRVFPGLFQPKENMPEDLRNHVRYPADMLLAQGLVYAKYHMTDPMVFYNQEDLWVRATEKYYNRVQPVQPYYVIWEPPSTDDPEFVLILPFTPKNRQVLIGWIAGMCDGENYGRFLAYKFPKEKRVLGPQQVETKIDQDRFLSGQLTLWDQRGSNVIRGNVLAIPIEETLLYVEPIYLQAETAAYPELRLVVVMHEDQLSYAESFDKALEGLFKEAKPKPELGPPGAAEATIDQLIGRASDAFDRYLKMQGQGNFNQAASALQTLKDTLEQLREQAGAVPEAEREQGGEGPQSRGEKE